MARVCVSFIQTLDGRRVTATYSPCNLRHMHAASGLQLDEYLDQTLPPMEFESTSSTPSTSMYPAPQWRLEVWELNTATILDDVARAVAAASPGAQKQQLRVFEDLDPDDTIQSEAGIKALLNGTMSAVSRALRMVGFARCKWVLQDLTAAEAACSAARAVAVTPQPASTVKVKGLVYKKPDFELLDDSGSVRTFVEVKVP